MSKQTKSKEEQRRVGPKFARNNVLPQNFQIRRPSSPMADLLDAADEVSPRDADDLSKYASSKSSSQLLTPEQSTGVKSTPVDFTPVRNTGVITDRNEYLSGLAEKKSGLVRSTYQLPQLGDFLDRVLPRFPPARQAIMLRLYRWNDGSGNEMIVSTPKLAAHTNMDEKSCRMHLHALIAEGFLVRLMDGEQIAKFGGSDRGQRGLLLRISGEALQDLMT
ncbi:MAG: hypothetical protein WKF30_06505 [Pyrinomonadaceae bacterium]